MNNCDICRVSSENVRLFDAINGLRMTTICERCSIINDIPIIKRPNSDQIKESEITRVSERMRSLSRIRSPINIQKRPEIFFREERLKELERNPELEQPEKENLKLMDNFHWEITKQRRKKGLSQKQLANAIGESEAVIQMIEKAKLPENAKKLIIKLEQIFQARLTKINEMPKKINKVLLINEKGRELEIIPEDEEMIFREDGPEEIIPTKTAEQISLERAEKVLGIKSPETTKKINYLSQNRDLDIRKINRNETTIGQLRNIHEERGVMMKRRHEEEQIKMEERKRIFNEIREREKNRKDILEKRRQEAERERILKEKKKEVEILREKEDKNFERYLGGSELLE